MSYNPNIPQPSDIPSQSQAQFLVNFQQLNTIFDVDHVPYNDADTADRGKHDKSTYVEQGSDPTTAANELALYSKDDGSGNTRLFLRQESAGTVIQISGANPSASANGTTFLPGGLILKWGTKANPINNDVISFSPAFPNNLFSVSITPLRANTDRRSMYIKTGAANTTSFTVLTDSSSFDSLYYVAIGN